MMIQKILKYNLSFHKISSLSLQNVCVSSHFLRIPDRSSHTFPVHHKHVAHRLGKSEPPPQTLWGLSKPDVILGDSAMKKRNPSSQNFSQLYSTNSEPFHGLIAKFNIDMDFLREEKQRQEKLTGRPINLHDLLMETVKEEADAALANLNDVDKRKLKIIQLEYDFLYSKGLNIPDPNELTSVNWLEAMNRTPSQRKRYYKYLQGVKFKKLKVMAKKVEAEARTTITDTNKENEVETKEHITPARDNKIFLFLYPATVKKWQNMRLSRSLMHGTPLVWDMDFADHMPAREIKNTADQLLTSYHANRLDMDPFHLYFTGCSKDHPVFRYMQALLLDDSHFMATVTPHSFSDIFSRKELIYLSPEGKEVMREYDPNAVYIIGAYNDMTSQKPLSYARAKSLGIRCQQLPLDEHLQWRLGSKSLTLDQMMKIFLAKKNNQSWARAFKAIPSRKLYRH